MAVELEKLRRGVSAFAGALTRARETFPGTSVNPAELDARVYAELSHTLGLDERELRDRLPKFAAERSRTAETPVYDRANAAFVAKDFGEAERLALRAAAAAAPANHAP